jgi:hypothetical protein
VPNKANFCGNSGAISRNFAEVWSPKYRYFNGNHENYFKLFDPVKFNEIVDSTVSQAQSVLKKLN